MATTINKSGSGYNVDWNSVLSSLMAGAGTGAAVGTAVTPGIGTAIGAIGGALVGAGSAFVPQEVADPIKPYNVNPLTAGMFASMGQDQAAASNWLKQAMAAYQGSSNNANNIMGNISQIKDTSVYNPQAGMNEYLARVPQLQQLIAGQFQQNRPDNQVMLDAQKAQLLREAQGSLDASGINFSSGAGMSALGSAAMKPMADQMALLQQQYGTALNNMLNQQAGITSQENMYGFEAQQKQYQNKVALQQMLLSGMLDQGRLQLGAAQIPASILNQLTGSMAQYGSPSFGTNEIFIPSTDYSGQIGAANLASILGSSENKAALNDLLASLTDGTGNMPLTDLGFDSSPYRGK